MQANTQVAVVIPAYRPGAPLVSLVDALLAGGAGNVVVVDDGSGVEFAELFEGVGRRDGVHVLHHAVNLGKGAALKSGLNYALAEIPGLLGVVSADADGQHHSDDILRIRGLLREHPERLILGVRQWEERVPWKSRVGNLVTRHVAAADGGAGAFRYADGVARDSGGADSASAADSRAGV